MNWPVVTASALALLLVACGGGNGGDAPSGYTLSGVIEADALNRVDSDTNDPETPMVRNNTPSEAQEVLAPAIIGGFVSAPLTASRFGPAGDEWDVYQVDLRAGQPIVLGFPDASVADLDLYLYDRSGTIIDASLGVGSRESLVVPRDDRYFVAVHAYAGRSNYSLRLDAVSSLSQVSEHRGPRLSDPFAPGEMIVKVVNTAGNGPARPEIDVQSLGLKAEAGAPDREQLWRIPAGRAEQVLDILGERRPAVDALRFADSDDLERYRTLKALKALERRPGIVSVSPNYRLQTQRLPNDPLQGLQWHHRNTDLPAAWDLSTGQAPDAEMIIAVIDTGVFLDHEDLRDRLVPGFDFISNPDVARDGDGIDPNPDDPGDSSQPGQSSWHGTHVAGTAAAATDNAIGIAGVSWGARIMPVRTVGKGGGLLYDTLQGIRFAAGLPNDSGTVPPRRADVINISLGGGAFAQAQADLYQQIRDLGIFVVAASGNSAGPVGFPAAYDAVFAVGATDAANQRAPYSSFGERLDLVAPGGDMRVDRTGDGYGDGVLSTVADDTTGSRRSAYAFYQGTSMATAVASGVVSLARSTEPGLTPDVFDFLLRSGALTDDLGGAGWDPETGWGLINARRTLGAVREWAGGAPLPPLLSVTPERLEFGFTESTLAFSLRNSGGGSLRIGQVIADAPWLSVTAGATGADGLGGYRAQVAREGLQPGEYRTSIRVTIEGGDERLIPVSLRVAAPELAADSVGRIYVLLVDASGEAVAETGVNPDGGRYRYRFEDVSQGDYRIVAGTDMDDDRQICDPGEACGAYPTLALFELLRVDRDLDGIDFSVGFRAGRPGLSGLSSGGADAPGGVDRVTDPPAPGVARP
ncbi:peptidase S8 and S53, subtilisin, kexin, sedolisin [Thioalkalivibrio nitratireducens DSM 14787]|uniref:Peptidase S8 and S53, subtilisin, kexin, sedolisin n=1 Tax=Thioalkalivibrio nitratireducens (strain DSM 14787 / UNIQEM 213 / ALEN2) TaxID=1255043 RepID=L0DU08_THIND|nr:S8 family serine peptidase [Thioalkalivibrio nitratireducens]AGA31846.1 peptidase S8 and S53, subtilisin, kexin, sedolisin [Thioalkalivibrio nitratireducens DSM 14787]